MQSPKWISALDLDRWATAPQAKSLLPELLRRLVYATIPREHIRKIDFPSGAEVQRPGYDGTTVVTQGTPFVPNGVCFWELGCVVNNAKGKAQDDYDLRIEEHKKRVDKGEIDNLTEATFVAVTAVDWQNGGSWAKDRTQEGYFKEVRAYDSNSLEHWLQDASAVSLWLAQEIHGRREGVIDLAEHWENLQATLRRRVPPKVLLVNRDDIKIAFANWLTQPNDQLVVKAPSAGELVAVFCAWVLTLLPEQQDAISSRAIIVENRDTWRALATSQQPLILIASPRLEPDQEIFAEAARKGHHVLRAAEFQNIDSSAIERAAKQLQTVGRALPALELLIMATHGGKIKFPPDIICDALEAIVANPAEHSKRSMDAYDVQEAFGYLHGCPQIDERRVARLEFEFLPFLDRHSRHLPKTLHKFLANEPDFFIDCLKLLYNPRHATTKEKHDENSGKAVNARRIWQLFREWQTIPGSNASGVISLNDLRIWVKMARQKSKDADRLAVCDLTIGELFGRAPEDTDKAKPPVAIREIIEECESEEMERGLATGLRNMRGGFSKSLYEGGKQERELAARYQQYADICSKWPRTAAALRGVAETYLDQADREDERAKARD
jgi:hypothetical protein